MFEDAGKPQPSGGAVTSKLGRVYLLLGGIFPGGSDGWVTSAGMLTLREQLSYIVPFSVYAWGDAEHAWNDMRLLPADHKIIVVGYSGGAWQATVMANKVPFQKIDLMILYDPSPPRDIQPIGTNVERAVCYHNNNPMMWWPGIGSIGGGRLVARIPGKPALETIEINGGKGEQHLLVQRDPALHANTVKEIKQCLDS